jgi:hypothetical protein
MNYKDVDEDTAIILKSLARMVHQVCDPDGGFDRNDFGAERTTMPYSAYANAVAVLELYGITKIIQRVYRVVTFKFTDGTSDWIYG